MPIPKLIATAVMMAAQVALTALQTTEGPRLTDTKATVADYGTPCNNFIGTRSLPAHCVFAKDIEEKKKKRKGKAGKQVSYTGYGTWFVQIAEHPIDEVLQIYFDNHLVYDRTGSGEKLYPLADDYDFEAHVRFMLGGEDQEPDPDMLAFIEARDGPDTCPAYRHMSGIYFERIPLEQLGNRRPDVRVLARAGGTAAQTTVDLDFQHGVYLINGTAVALEDAAISDGGMFDPDTDIVPGVGLLGGGGPAYHHGVALTAAGIAAATGGNPAGGFDVDVDFYLAFDPAVGGSPDLSAEAAYVYVTAFDYTVGFEGLPLWNVTLKRTAEPANGSYLTDSSNVGNQVPVALSSVGEHSASVSFRPNQLSATVEGEATTTIGAPQTIAPEHIHFGGEQVGTNVSLGVRRYDHEAVIRRIRFTSPPASDEPTLETLLTRVALRGGLEADEFDFSQATQVIPGYSWTQGSGQQIAEAVCDVFDVDVRPHDFTIESLPRGMEPIGSIDTDEFVFEDGQEPFKLDPTADEDLPRRVSLTFADTSSGQEPNAAMPIGTPDVGASGSAGESAIDMQTLALDPDTAQAIVERRQRRMRFGRTTAEFGLTRRRIELEPGDVFAPSFWGDVQTMRLKKTTNGADGVIASEWERDDPRIAVLPGSVGAPMAGYRPPAVLDAVASVGDVLDVPLLIDSHDQTAPLAYLVAGPVSPDTWTGADFAMSDTGELDSYLEGWDGIASSDGAVIGTTIDALPEALPWTIDNGSSIAVAINQGEMTSATLEELLSDPTRNLAAVKSGDAWELVQFTTATLTDALEYTLTGLLRGVRGTEHAIAGHAPGDRFVLLDGTVKLHTMGAAEVGDTDSYVVTTTGQALDQTDAFELAYTGASHRPLAPVNGSAELVGADWEVTATRRTRVGGASLDNQDVPLGQASELWRLEILDGASVVRTIEGAALPLTWTEAQQIADFGIAQGALTARLRMVDPTLNLGGYPLDISA